MSYVNLSEDRMCRPTLYLNSITLFYKVILNTTNDKYR